MTSWKIVNTLELNLPKEKPQRVYYAAMGGSALPADLLNDLLQGEYHLQIVRDYQLPNDVSKKDLVLCASFSGNTEETLAIYEDAQTRHCPIIAIANGGQLKEKALQDGVPFISIPDCIQPRCATGYFFASILALLHQLQLISSKKEILEKLSQFLQKHQDQYESQGKEITTVLKGRVPIIYGPSNFYAVCRIWKIKFNENSKIQSFFNVFPELNHNEMVGFTRMIMNPTLIYLKSQFMHPRILKRMNVMKEVLGEKVPIFELDLSGNSLLEESFAALSIGDYASYHLAQAYNIDPAPVVMVEDFKKLLK